jgi:hypothetical protein
MEGDNELFGPVQFEKYGIIMVPGKNPEERVAYAGSLSVREGVFIPSGVCTSVITLDNVEANVPHIAMGTLDSYGCYTIEDLLWVPDNYTQLIANLSELIEFARYTGSIELEQKLLRIELGLTYLNDLQQMLISKSAEEVQVVLNALISLSLIFRKGTCRDSITREQIIQAKNNVSVINQILPDLKGVKRGGTRFIATNVKFSEIAAKLFNGNLCILYFGEMCKELANAIAAVYNLKYLQQSGRLLTPTRKEEILQVGPAIVLQPGGVNIQAYKQQGLWTGTTSTAMNINPTYRQIYQICGGVINHDSLIMLANELDITIPPGYTDDQICNYIKTYVQKYKSQ